jgi:hypothetical protein
MVLAMRLEIRITEAAFSVAAACAFAICGCAAPMIPSQRFQSVESLKTLSGPVPLVGHRFGMQDPSECTSCEDRQRLQDYGHAAMPYVAGPFMHPGNAPAYAAHQATIKPPHSKFHPVPTRPVFETRAEYHPPEPMGVHLVPVPDHHSHSLLPRLRPPDVPLGYPPTPPDASSQSLGTGDDDEAGPFMLQAPGN